MYSGRPQEPFRPQESGLDNLPMGCCKVAAMPNGSANRIEGVQP